MNNDENLRDFERGSINDKELISGKFQIIIIFK